MEIRQSVTDAVKSRIAAVRPDVVRVLNEKNISEMVVLDGGKRFRIQFPGTTYDDSIEFDRQLDSVVGCMVLDGNFDEWLNSTEPTKPYIDIILNIPVCILPGEVGSKLVAVKVIRREAFMLIGERLDNNETVHVDVDDLRSSFWHMDARSKKLLELLCTEAL